MSVRESAVFIFRLVGLPVIDATGDRVGRVKDVVFHLRTGTLIPRVRGLVVGLFARQRIFAPMTRIHNTMVNQITILGQVDTRRFKKHGTEWLVATDLFDRPVLRDVPTRICNVSMIQMRNREWELFQIAVASHTRVSRFGFGGRHVTGIIQWNQIPDLVLATGHSPEHLVAKFSGMKPADIVRELHGLGPDRLMEVIKALNDETLARALEELPEDEQIQLISKLETNRVADVLAEMDPDDTADLIKDLPKAVAEGLLEYMEPEDASDTHRLLIYGEFTAGGMMTPEPVVLGTNTTVAETLARTHEEQLTPALASMVFVTHPPLETPSGHYVGAVHSQQLLQATPTLMVATIVDHDLEPLSPDPPLAQVPRFFATYNLVAAPVMDSGGTLVRAVTVNDILDHVLPDGWRGTWMDEPVEMNHD